MVVHVCNPSHGGARFGPGHGVNVCGPRAGPWSAPTSQPRLHSEPQAPIGDSSSETEVETRCGAYDDAPSTWQAEAV